MNTSKEEKLLTNQFLFMAQISVTTTDSQGNPIPMRTYWWAEVATIQGVEYLSWDMEASQEENGVEVYKTTEGNFLAKVNGVEHLYDSKGKIFHGTIEKFGAPTAKVRSDNAIYKTIAKEEGLLREHKSKFVPVDNVKWFEVLFDKDTFSLIVDMKGDLIPITKEGVDKMKSEFDKFEKLKTSFTAWASGTYRLGDRVLLYWPTGTGKTFDFLATVEQMKKDGKLDEYAICGITEGYEDMDFLAYIVPSDKGIKYVEKDVVRLLRDAAAGKKVAILLDELNRWSKSFLNLVLKLLDAVDGKTYTLNNFIKDEQIVIPIENILFFATMNLWGKYVGTNALDEALFDRFNIVQFKGYNKDVEDDIANNFGWFKKEAMGVISHIRDLHKEGEIRAPISTRGVKMWAEAFINSPKSRDDMWWTFSYVLLNRLISVDDFGNPNGEEIAIIMKHFKDKWMLV